jgi:hypothetical protein
LLITVLFSVYRTTADVALRIKYQKQLGVWVINLQTNVQNILDTHTIDYMTLSWYRWGSNTWWTKSVPLLSEDNQKALLELDGSGWVQFTTFSGTALVWTASLLPPDMFLSGATFVIMPARDPKIDRCKASVNECFSYIIHPGVRMIGWLYPTQYDRISFPIQTFFSLLKK